MKFKNKRIITGIIIIILIVIALCTKNDSIIKYVEENYNIDLGVEIDKNKSTNSVNTIECEVMRIVDGDTIVVNYNGKEEKVRLIGIDTPESVHPNESKNTEDGIKVSDYTKERLSGKLVEIELDLQERDKYGRILAYVYIDGQMYNKELLEIGYAKIATYPPNVKYVDDFKEIQKDARESKVGLWGEE